MPFCLNREPAGGAVLNGSMTASNHIVNMMVEYHADVALTHLHQTLKSQIKDNLANGINATEFFEHSQAIQAGRNEG